MLLNSWCTGGARPSASFSFSAGSVVDTRGGVVPTFARATTKVGTDWEGKPFLALSGEVVFAGLRRVRNLYVTTSQDFSNAAWLKGGSTTATTGFSDPQGGTLACRVQWTAGTLYRLYQAGVSGAANGRTFVVSGWIKSNTGGTQTFRLGLTSAAVADYFSPDLTATTAFQRFSFTKVFGGGDTGVLSAAGIAADVAGSVGDLVVFGMQVEEATGQSNINPSEYVSVGVLSTPFHGAKVDGVKNFPYLSGNTVTANVVTEASGAAIPKRSGLGIGWLPGANLSFFSTPDSAAASVTGDIDVRAYVAPTSWTPAVNSMFVSKLINSGNYSYDFWQASGGLLQFRISLAGTILSSCGSSVTPGFVAGTAHWVRATRVASTGVVTFYTSDDGLTWTQLGTTQATTAGAIFDGTDAVQVGSNNAAPLAGNIYRAQILNGIGGPVVVDFNPTSWSTGTTFVAPTGETWTLNGGAKVNKFANGYYPEVASTNLVLQSEDFSTTWTAVGTPTRTGNAKQCGFIKLDLIGDDDAAAIEGYTQVVTFTADGVKSRSFFFAQGTSTSSVLRIRDTTAAADRLLAAITWTSGIPTVTMTTGTLIGVFARGNGVWRVEVLTTAVTAANANQVECYPATDAALAVANTGNLYWGGEQAENNATRCSSYIPTTTVTVTRNKDDMSVTALGSWFNANAGAIVASITPGIAEAQNRFFADFNDGTSNNAIENFATSGPVGGFFVSAAAATQANIGAGALPAATGAGVSTVYALNDFALIVNGVVTGTDVVGTIPAVTRVDIGQAAGGGSQFNGLISSLDYYPQRVSNATLQALTA